MKETVAEVLYTIFNNLLLYKSSEHFERDVIQNILDSTKWENETEMDFFVKVKNSHKIPILLIIVEKNETKEIETYQIFRLESNKWEMSNIEDIINMKRFLLMSKFEQDYHIVDIFTEDHVSDMRNLRLISQGKHLVVHEIAIYLLMRDPKSPRLRYIWKHRNGMLTNWCNKNLFQVLHEKGRNDAIAFLLQNECPFPFSEIERNIPLVKKQLQSNQEFHEYIKDGNREAIDKFLDANPNQQYIYNEDNESACWVAAMKMRNFELFSFLCKRGLTFTDTDITYELIRRSEFSLTKTVSGLDLYSKSQILESQTFITNKQATDLTVNEIFKELRKMPSVNLILNILNKIGLYIHIDYKESISTFSPYRFEDHENFSYDDNTWIKRIFITHGGETKQLFGTFALEITHFAMLLLFKNNGKPYYFNDNKSQKRFNEIVQDIRKKVSNRFINDEIIKSVYAYPDKYWHSELITRVNYIFAFYGQDIGYQILQQQTPNLLQFYETCVKPDLEKYLRGHFNQNYNLFNTKWHEEMENRNKYFHELNNLWIFTNAAYSKNVMIQSDCVQLTCLKLFKNITRCNNSPINIDNTYFIDLETFSYNNYAIVSHLPQSELLILFDTYKKPFVSVVGTNISQYISKVAKRFIFIFDSERNSSYPDIDNVVTFTESFKPNNIDWNSKKLIYDTFEINFQEQMLKLRDFINFEEYFNILHKSMTIELLNDFFSKLSKPERVVKPPLIVELFYINRKFKTTIFELDELRDEIVEKYDCQNITDESKDNQFELRTKNNKLIIFPGKTLRIKEGYKPVSDSMTILPENNRDQNDIFIISVKNSSESFIIIDEEKEIQINNFSYTDMETFYENNRGFNIHWFVESDSSHHFFHHLKTFGSFDKARSFCYRQKCTIDEEDLLKKLKNQKVFLIAAPAGMGKTETIKKMAANLAKKDASMWTPVVVLKKCTEILKTFRPENSDQDYLFDFLTKFLDVEVCFKYVDFEKEMFKVLCKRKPNNVCLFLDGADENGPEYTDVIIELIKRLSQTNIKHIIVTTRLIGKFEFEFKLDTIATEMEPFSYDEKTKILMNIWKLELRLMWTSMDRYFFNHKIEIARRVAKNFNDFDDFLDNSLQIMLVAKICVDQLQEFAANLININLYFRDELSLIEMYKKFIENKFNINYEDKLYRQLLGLTKMSVYQNDAQVKNSQEQLRYAAIRVLLNDDEVKLFLTSEEIKLHKNYIEVVSNWRDCEGIIDAMYSEKLNFVHRTYTEYFFADFLLNYYKDWNENTEQFFFEHILVKKEFAYVRKFLNSYKGSSDLLRRQPTYFQIPTTLHDAVVQNIEDNNIKILHYLYSLGFNLTINPSSLITTHIYNHSPNSIEKLIATIKYLIKNCGNVHLSINELGEIKKVLHWILFEDRIELIKALLQCELTDLDDEELQKDHKPKSFLSLWDEAKAKVKTDHENKDSKNLLALFNDILQMINING